LECLQLPILQMYRVQESRIHVLIVGGGYSLANSFIMM
jgi:hypothetical protein